MQVIKTVLISILLWIVYSILSLIEAPFWIIPIALLILGYVFGRLWTQLTWIRAIFIVLSLFAIDAVLIVLLNRDMVLAIHAFSSHFTFPIRALIAYLSGVKSVSFMNFISMTMMFYSPFMFPVGVATARKFRKNG